MTTTTVTRLKELLFDTESQRLDEVQRRIEALDASETARHGEAAQRYGELQRRVDQVFERSGTEERLQKSVAAILDGAFREAEISKHDQLSQAVAPLVVKTIKFELKNSQDEMVDALYPLTGKLVKQYVNAEMARLMAEINAKLGGSSAKPSELDARAKSLNLTVAELVLAETQHLKVDELFLVRRGSGDLVAHWERPEAGAAAKPATAAGSNRDVLIAGYLSGITAFSEEAFDEKKGSLRAIDMDGERIFVRASPAYLLAARCSGSAPQAVEQVINDEFVRVVSDYKQALASQPAGQSARAAPTAIDALLPNLAAAFERRFSEERTKLAQRASATAKPAGFGRLYALAACLLLPLLAWSGWSMWQSMETARVQSTAQRVISATSELRGYPVLLDVERGGRAMTVTGLMPTADVRDTVLRTLQRDLSGTAIRDRFGLLPQTAIVTVAASAPNAPPFEVSPEFQAMKRDLAAARQQSTDLALRVTELTGKVAPLPAELQKQTRRIDGLPAPVASNTAVLSPRDELDVFARANALFFLNGVDLTDETRAAETIEKLASLLAKTESVLRVIGYTDDRGQASANTVIAQSRADRIAQMLIARGVPRERIVALGRIGSTDLSRSSGPGSANRRVIFEVGFIGEPIIP
jgi:outer membrane protein OmpA-like peptidoglycan-associated protein